MTLIHLTSVDYRIQSWKNGRGTTTELLHLIDPASRATILRLSRASVVEDGPFSLFPGIERSLTVLSGPGFRLNGGGIDLRCDPLVPVSFPGDVEVMATDTKAQPSDDFNVMTARHLPRPEVVLAQNDTLPGGGQLALYALGPCRVNETAVAREDLILTTGPVTLSGDGPVLAIRVHGVNLIR